MHDLQHQIQVVRRTGTERGREGAPILRRLLAARLPHHNSTQIFNTQPRALPNTESPLPIDALSRMELTRSIDKATDKISNSPAQMNARQPVFGVLPFPALAPPYPIRPWVSVPIQIPRQRMSYIVRHPEMTTDRRDTM